MTQIVPLEQRYKELRTTLEKNKGAIASALPRHLNADRMLRVALTSIRKNPKLLECDQSSFMLALLTSAQLGLEPDGVTGQAYLLPVWNGKLRVLEAQFRVGYRGLMDLARRSREIGSWFMGAVYEKDSFDFEFGSEAFLRHKPYAGAGSAGDLINSYAGAKLKDGGVVFRVLNRQDIERAKKSSSSRDAKANLVGPWVTDEAEMAIKTAIIRVCKWLPTSPELATAIALEEQAERGLPQELNAFVAPDDAPVSIPAEAEVVSEPAEEKAQAERPAKRGKNIPDARASADTALF